MKKTAIFCLLLTVLAGSLFADHIRITRPASAVTWRIGRSESVTWDYSGVTGQVKLTLFKDGARLGNIAHDLPIGDRSFNWTVGSYGSGLTAAAGSGYQVRIAVQEQEDAFTHTSPSFSLDVQPTIDLALTQAQLRSARPSPPPSDIQVVYPNGGETLNQGSEYQIRWTAPDSFGRPRVIFRKAGHAVKTIEPEAVFPVKIGDTWRLSWIVGAEFDTSGDYDIRLEKADHSQGDFSDRLFRIVTGVPYIVYTGPNERELILGRSELIRWRAGNLHDPITLVIEKEGGATYGIEPFLPADARSHRWLVGRLEREARDFYSPTANYRFGLTSEGAVVTKSAYFKLVRPDLEVVEPAGGEIHRGDSVTIRWRNDGFRGNVTVEAWYDSGGGVFRRYNALFENVENTGAVALRLYPRSGGEIDPPPTGCHWYFRVFATDIPFITDNGPAFTLRN